MARATVSPVASEVAKLPLLPPDVTRDSTPAALAALTITSYAIAGVRVTASWRARRLLDPSVMPVTSTDLASEIAPFNPVSHPFLNAVLLFRES